MVSNNYNPKTFLYLASPYTHDDPKVRQWRYEQAMAAAVKMASEGTWVFSPIVYTHPMCINHSLPVPFEFWAKWDEAMIRASAGLVVLEMDGWEQSKGIEAELKFAVSIKKPISFYGWLHRYEEAQSATT